MTDDPVLAATLELRRRMMSLLAGQPAPIQGAVLADLLAMWVAGHTTLSKRGADKLRANVLALHIETVRNLIPPNVKLIHGGRP